MTDRHGLMPLRFFVSASGNGQITRMISIPKIKAITGVNFLEEPDL